MENEMKGFATVMAAVRKECALYYPTQAHKQDYCCGGDPLTLKEFNSSGTCLIPQGKKCPWFTSSILPGIAERREDGRRIAKAYGDLTHAPTDDSEFDAIRFCECGKQVLNGNRICEDCKREKYRNRLDDARRKRRNGAGTTFEG